MWEALDALSHELELCRIDPESHVVVVIGDRVGTERVALVRAAVARTGAAAIEIHPISAGRAQTNTALLTNATGDADVVVILDADTSPDGERPVRAVRSSDGIPEWIADDGPRVLYLADVEPQSYPPHANLRRRVGSLHENLTAGSTLLLADENGSDLRVDLLGARVDADHGYLDDDSRSACFPAGWVSVAPARGTVDGTLVIMPGDAGLGTGRTVASPVALEIASDLVTDISGESPDADTLRALFEYPDDPNAYGIAELSVGLNPAGRPAQPFDRRLLDPVVGRLLAGVVTISFGENLVADRPCAQRFTMALVGRDLSADGVPLVRRGRLEGDLAPDVYEL